MVSVNVRPFRSESRFFAWILSLTILAAMSTRAIASYTSTISGNTVIMTGNSSGDDLKISQSGDHLKHNRKSSGDGGFASDFDFNSSLSGDQLITTAPGIVIAVNGGGGNDIVEVIDKENTISTNYTVTSTTITGRYTLGYQNVDTVILFPGSGFEQDKILATATEVRYTCNLSGGGGKSITFGNSAHKLDDIQGSVEIVEGSITLDDTGQTAGFAYTIESGSSFGESIVTRPGVAAIDIFDFSSSEIRTGSGNDTFLANSAGGPMTLSGGPGTNSCIMGGRTHSLQDFSGALLFNGGTSNDSLILDNTASTTPDVYEFGNGSFSLNSERLIGMNSVQTASVLAGSSHNYARMDLNAATFTPAVFWNLGQEDNSNILEINGAGSADNVTISGPGKNVTGTSSGTPFAGVSWDHVDLLLVNGVSGVDSFAASPSSVTDMLLNGDAPATSPGDALTLTSGGQAFTLTNDSYLVEGFQPVEFQGFESVATPTTPHGPDFIGFFGFPVVSCKTSSSGTACSIKGSLLELNAGDQPAGFSATQFFLSDDNVVDGSDTALNTVSVKGLKTGGFKAVKISAKLTAGVDPAGKFLIARLDNTNSVAELRESNNVVVFGPLSH